MSSSYCSSCKIELQNDDTIRDHYKSEFHRYNIKRKLVGLPPVTVDQFSQKKAQLLAESSQSERDQLIKCELCSKTFASKGTYKQHLESNKHKENLKKFNRKGRGATEGEENKQDYIDTSSKAIEDPAVCLFCNKRSPDVDENLVHMRLTHSFFISEFKHLKDLKGLLKHLAIKIHRKGLCINCGAASGKDARPGEAVQRHMLDKGHVFMDTEDFGEYERFYDFSKVVEELRRHNLMVDKDEVVNEEDEYLEIDMGNDEERDEDDNEDDWEIIDAEDGAQKKFRLKRAKLLDSGEIRLPNGHILGHRRYKNAYKQYYRENAKDLLENSALEFGDDKMIAARQEENRLMALSQEIMRKERTVVENQAHKFFYRKGKENLRQSMKANKIQHYFRKQLN